MADLLRRLPRAYRPIIREAIDQGAQLDLRPGSRHPFRLTCPSGRVVTLSGTPSDVNGHRVLVQHLRHAGLVIAGRGSTRGSAQ